MKTHLHHLRVPGELSFADQASRFLTFCGAVAICAASSVIAHGQSSGSSPVKNGLFTHSGDSFRVVDTAGFKTAADIGSVDPASIQQVGHGACTSCGTSCGGACGGSTIDSSCGSCGTACGGRCGGRSSALTCGPKFTNPCQPCVPYRYAMVEALYMVPDSDNFRLSPNFGMNDFDFEVAPRITIGAVSDCVHGCEASFTGPFDWDMSGQLSSAGGGINSFLRSPGTAGIPGLVGTPGIPAIPAVPPSPFASFTNATFQSQRLDAEYYSLEASKTLVGWEMAKLLIGGRYINYDEEFNYFSQTAASGNGRLRSEAQNDLIGLQVGMDLLYPISRHGFSDFRARAGAYYNMIDTNFTAIDGATTLANNSADDGELAGVFEIGSGIRYQLGEMLAVRAGAELWYISGVATATEQFNTTIGSGSGRRLNADDDILFTGLSVGAELRY